LYPNRIDRKDPLAALCYSEKNLFFLFFGILFFFFGFGWGWAASGLARAEVLVDLLGLRIGLGLGQRSHVGLGLGDDLRGLLCLPLRLPSDLAGAAPLGVNMAQLGEALLLGLGEEEVGPALAAGDSLACRLLVLAGLAALGAPHGSLPVVLLEEDLVLAREDEAVRAVGAREVHVRRERRKDLLLGPLSLPCRSRALRDLGGLGLLFLDVCGLLSLELLLELEDLLLHAVDQAADLWRVLANRDATEEIVEVRLRLEEGLLGDERHFGMGWRGGGV